MTAPIDRVIEATLKARAQIGDDLDRALLMLWQGIKESHQQRQQQRAAHAYRPAEPISQDPTERVARLMFANSRETAWADLSEDDKELWRDGARINIALNPGYYAALVAWMGRALEVPAMPADEPHACDCSVCGRKSWSGSDMGQPCGMAQPDGTVCPGTMR